MLRKGLRTIWAATRLRARCTTFLASCKPGGKVSRLWTGFRAPGHPSVPGPALRQGRNCAPSCATRTWTMSRTRRLGCSEAKTKRLVRLGLGEDLGWRHLGKGGATGRLLGPREAGGAGGSALGYRGPPGIAWSSRGLGGGRLCSQKASSGLRMLTVSPFVPKQAVRHHLLPHLLSLRSPSSGSLPVLHIHPFHSFPPLGLCTRCSLHRPGRPRDCLPGSLLDLLQAFAQMSPSERGFLRLVPHVIHPVLFFLHISFSST